MVQFEKCVLFVNRDIGVICGQNSVARHGCHHAGHWPVQTRHKTLLTSKEYVTRKAWREASLERCPSHPRSGCHFHRHGTYPRVDPPGMRIARYYCPESHETYSLLPDCLSSHFRGDLADVEEVVAIVEASKSVEAAANIVRSIEISLPCAVRWVRRRLQPVRAALLAIFTLLPQIFAGCTPSVGEARRILCTTSALPSLRELSADRLGVLPPPLGFGPRVKPRRRRRQRRERRQQKVGADPPGYPV
ncbi:MAG: hypothetical protein NUV51_01835 [Sulfuricaulis sp.]|nr:hypothetical protein [Sulfuricaulis sp.]